ncbi:MAG: class I SAM-dependent methyltransferase [Pseudomonadota bacterium]
MTQANAAHMTDTGPDYVQIKTKQQGAWSSGDYAKVGVTLQITGEVLCESMDLRAGASVLDVAAGNGNVTLAAARRFCRVTSTDYVPALLEDSKRRAEAEGLPVEYQQADAEKLPFADAMFDNVVSTFGVMFAPDQFTAASELARVCKPGGTIGMANWTPDSFIGQLFKTIGGYVQPPVGVQSPARWGSEDFLNDAFAHQVKSISTERKSFAFRYQSAEHWLDIFRTFYGPVLKAFEAVGAEKGDALAAEIMELIVRFNVSGDATMVVPSDYLEVIIKR